MRILRRTTRGVVAGWLGIVMTTLVALAWIPLPFMLLMGFDIRNIPWQMAITLIVATIITVALLWYSRSTQHLEWIRRSE